MSDHGSRHALFVRVTQWLTTIAFLALLVTGAEITISHPRFYWGETGNSGTPVLFKIPIPSSRSTAPTGYKYVLPDQNGWSRYLHFEAAWLVLLTGLIYGIAGFVSGHFKKDLMPPRADWSWRAIRDDLLQHVKLKIPDDTRGYNLLQRIAYLKVIFLLFPLVILTGLAMSPSFNAAVPVVVNALGGRQSARTLHFLVSAALLIFLVVHVAMLLLSGFWSRTRAMISGNVEVHT